jgi:hypothetical protein
MLGGFLHICTCTCTIYCGLWPPDNTSCIFLTWYQSVRFFFWTRNSSSIFSILVPFPAAVVPGRRRPVPGVGTLGLSCDRDLGGPPDIRPRLEEPGPPRRAPPIARDCSPVGQASSPSLAARPSQGLVLARRPRPRPPSLESPGTRPRPARPLGFGQNWSGSTGIDRRRSLFRRNLH